MDKNARAYLLELIGTFAVVFISAGVVCTNAMAVIAWAAPAEAPGKIIIQPEPGLAGIALAYGCMYAVALAFTLPSGGYLNPVLPLALWVFKRMDTAKAFALIGVQLLGAAAAGGALRLIFSFREDVLTTAQLGTPHVNYRAFDNAWTTPRLLLSGIGMELVLTFVLTFVIFATLVDPRAKRWLGRWRACMLVGLAVIGCTLAGFWLTGAAMNPARWFGTVVWEMSIPSLHDLRPFRDQVVYWFGPIAGALLASATYVLLLLPAEEAGVSAGAAPAGKHATGAAATLFRSRK